MNKCASNGIGEAVAMLINIGTFYVNENQEDANSSKQKVRASGTSLIVTYSFIKYICSSAIP